MFVFCLGSLRIVETLNSVHFIITIILAVQPFVGAWLLFQLLNPIHSR
jgi:hypothetical protein